MDNHHALYYRVLPPKQDIGESWPTVVVMHGRGSNEEDLMGLHPDLPPEWAMVSLRAPEVLGPNQYQWYRPDSPGNPELSSLDRSVDAVHAFIETLPIAIPRLDTQRWVLGGFSQGGLMTAALLQKNLTTPPIGSIILSGYFPETVVLNRDLRGYPIFWGHGMRDPVLLPNWAESGVKRLQGLGADVTFKRYPGLGHSVNDQELDDLRTWLASRKASR